MKVNILASGSGGNCIVIQSGETIILVDAGEAKTRIEKLLLKYGIAPKEIKAIYITHAHKDHAYGVSVANKYRIPVYASEGSWKEKVHMSKVDEELRKVMKVGESVGYESNELTIQCFDTHHDDLQPLGYVIKEGNYKCSVCLDTGQVDSEMLEEMKDSDIYILEANHDVDMCENNEKYPTATKARILSHIGHLSNQQTAEALYKLVQGKGEQIYLTHLSASNNLPMLAEMTVKRALKKKGFEAGKHYEIEVV